MIIYRPAKYLSPRSEQVAGEHGKSSKVTQCVNMEDYKARVLLLGSENGRAEEAAALTGD